MKKVLIVYNKIFPYRVPIFNLLAKEFDLTVTYSLGNSYNGRMDFNLMKLPVKKYNRFVVHKGSLYKLAQNFDVVIGYGDISWLSIMKLMFKSNRKYKVILWGIGLRASYKTRYGDRTIWDHVRYYLMGKSDAILFYSKEPIPLYLEQGFTKKKLFVADNTVKVLQSKITPDKSSIVFIGTLYRQKKIYNLLESYHAVKQKVDNVPILNIIGDGDEYTNIMNWINRHQYQNCIKLKGKIFDEEVLCEYFEKAIACISPGQAGLSVLKSMGYGVPFITKENAITGGEIFNIEHNISGVLYKEDEELENIIKDICYNKSKYIEMGLNAKIYYEKYRRPEHMVLGMKKAIEFVLQN
ncbi:glycosyltransferase [Flagellimonas lutaonensis]|uniref:Glycosyl transferase group 1 n=1 Tax=Flagellimonas lutaonensis TaxID=516051 RepID=A0A0D5YVZ6_9FLAO|nr:glycosyltransferase [Allomuricauda lutaonensis]AKA36076.1 Glycosyl transferase group 1 [Allomuricauda lutaonensis]